MTDLERIYHDHYKFMMYYAIKMVDEDTARDVCQNVFLSLSKKNYSYEDMKKMIAAAVKNECINTIKSTNRRAERAIIYEPTESELDRWEIESAAVTIIYNNLHKLPRKCRRCIELYYFENLKCKEIGQLLGIAPSTVTSQLNRGIGILKNIFKTTDILT